MRRRWRPHPNVEGATELNGPDSSETPSSDIASQLNESQPRRSLRFFTWLLAYLPPMLAGALCLPATYDFNRTDRYLAALRAVFVIGTLGGATPAVLSGGGSKPRLLRLVSAFVIGALASEIVVFAMYFIDVGYRDPELVLGVFGDALEFCYIAGVGGAATWFGASAGLLVRRTSSTHDPQQLTIGQVMLLIALWALGVAAWRLTW
jgi:hypothetical protein